MSESMTLEAPAHVPPELVFHDFDFFALEVPDGDPQRAWTKVRDRYPRIFWTTRNGGHWVATRAAELERMQVDYAHFSHAQSGIPRARWSTPTPPVDLDPPEHGPYRAVISPAFSPRSVAAVEGQVRSVLRGVLDRITPRGECEFMGEVAQVMPITVFLGMMGLPAEDAEVLLPLIHLNTQAVDAAVAHKTRMDIQAYLAGAIDDRRANPRDDLLSQVVHAQVNGKPMSDMEVRGMCTLLLGGGLDTVASMMGFIARFLATHPGHLQQLVDDRSLIPRAVDEFIRRHGMSNTARTATHDFEFAGVQLKKGDQVQGPTCLISLDPERVKDPLTVDFLRPLPISSASFGSGPRRCPGIALSRMELKVFLEEWLARIPVFQLKPGTRPWAAIGMTNTMRELWLSWTPGRA